MSGADADDQARLVAARLSAGRVTLFVGAGIHAASDRSRPPPQFPSVLAETLAETVRFPDRGVRDLTMVAEYTIAVLGRAVLYEELHRRLADEGPTTPAAAAVARIAGRLRDEGQPALVVTTNYDVALERALDEQGEPYDVVSYIADGPMQGRFTHNRRDAETVVIARPNEYAELPSSGATILKLLGSLSPVDPKRDSYVIGLDDVVDYLPGGMTELPVVLAEALTTSHWLFLGLSPHGRMLRLVLNRLGPQRDYQSWAVERDPSLLSTTLWARGGIDVVDSAAEQYLELLDEAMAERLAAAPERKPRREAPLELLPARDGGLVARSGGNVRYILSGHDGPVVATALAPDELRGASASADGTVRVWDLTKRQELVALTAFGGALDVAISPAGALLAWAGADGTVVIWNLDEATAVGTVGTHSGPVLTIAFSPDGEFLATGGEDGDVVAWRPGATAPTLAIDVRDPVLAVAYSPDGHAIAVGTRTGRVETYSTETGLPRSTSNHAAAVIGLAFDGSAVAVALADGTVVNGSPALAVERTADGDLLVTGPGRARLLDPQRPPLSEPERVGASRWQAVLEPRTAETLRVGETATWELVLEPAAGDGVGTVTIPETSLDLTVYLEASGFHLEGEHVRTLPVVAGTPAQRRLRLAGTALASGDRRVQARLYPGGGIADAEPATASCEMHVVAPVILRDRTELIDPRAIPEPTPDVVLHVALEETPDGERLGLHVTSPVLGLDCQRLEPSLPLTGDDIAGLRDAALDAAAGAQGAPPPEILLALRSFGAALFDVLMPPGHPLRDLYWRMRAVAGDDLWSWFVVGDERASLPWELVCPHHLPPGATEPWYDDFLGDRCMTGHWVGGQGLRLVAEAPLGRVDLAHFENDAERIRPWLEVLGGEAEATAERVAGATLLARGTPYYGIHLLRFPTRREIGRIALRDEDGGDEQGRMLTRQRLDLTFHRPLVSVSVPSDGAALDREEHDARLEQRWVLPFLHAGATAVVGPRWSVAADSDQRFVRSLYDGLRTGLPVGAAVHEARTELRLTAAHRSDWLAYSLFGHPACTPYRVQPARGFALFEALDEPETGNLRAGHAYRFRASFRLDAPGWFDGRLHAPGDTDLEGLSVLLLPLTGGLPETYPLGVSAGGESAERVVTLVIPPGEPEFALLVRFQRGSDELRSLIVELPIEETA